jgi:hypothetical protein
MLTGAKLTEVYTSAQLTGSEAGTAPAPGDLFFGRGGKIYKFVQYDSGAGPVAAVAGNVAYYYAPGGTSAGATLVVTSDLSDSAQVGAGVLQAAPADGEYCWIQIKGDATITPALTAGADGDPLTPTGATDGTLDVTDNVTSAVCAFVIDADAKIIKCDFPF